MTRYVKTVSASGASSGGAAGLSAQDVCGVIETYPVSYTHLTLPTTPYV